MVLRINHYPAFFSPGAMTFCTSRSSYPILLTSSQLSFQDFRNRSRCCRRLIIHRVHIGNFTMRSILTLGTGMWTSCLNHHGNHFDAVNYINHHAAFARGYSSMMYAVNTWLGIPGDIVKESIIQVSKVVHSR